MWRFILITFGFLGWSFYELSDGADFVPELAEIPIETKPLKTIVAAASTPTVAREPQMSQASLNLPETSTATSSAHFVTARQTNAQATEQTTDRVNVTLTSVPPEPTTSQDTVTSQPNTGTENVVASAQPEPEAAPILPPIDLRTVTKNRVNMREGPSTDFAVVTKLSQGMKVEILFAPGDGWFELRVVETGEVGWIADYLVTAAN